MIIGITGHQDLGNEESIIWISNEVRNKVLQLKPESGVSCLAVGADQLFASILKEEGIPLKVIIPCSNYENTFKSQTSKLAYLNLLSSADNILKLKFKQPSEEAFFEASKLLVENSKVLFAVWDNLKAKGKGGTADVVKFAKIKKKQIIHFNPINKTIKSIN